MNQQRNHPKPPHRGPPPNRDVFVSGVPQIPLHDFISSLLPPVLEGVQFTVKEQLTKHSEKHALAHDQGQTSRNNPPRDLISLFNTVVGAAASSSLGPARVKLIVPPCHSDESLPHAEFRTVASHSLDGLHPWLEMAIPWRSNSNGKYPTYNHEHVIWDCYNILREDARRRFTFGITIDGQDVRLWFFSRSHSVVSEPHNFTRDSDPLIGIFLSIAFATPEQLGYDHTISYFLDDAGSVQYKLSLKDVVYVTKKLLSDHRADVVCGRATRVWEAYREDDSDCVSVVIKDLWTSISEVQEGAQLQDLHEQLRTLEDPGTPRPPSDYFLTVIAHGFVQTLDGADDHTIDVMMRSHRFPADSANHSPRRHYRIVFNELGVAINRMKNMAEVMRSLADATRALSLLRRLGFVHRDVSAGNILLVDGVGKLTDLEYLKSFKGDAGLAPSDPDIGTPEYTAVEVAVNRYIWYRDGLRAHGRKPSAPRPSVPFLRFHPLYDLESTIWIALWALLYHRRSDDANQRSLDDYFPADRDSGAVVSRMAGLRSGFLPPKPSDPFSPILDLLDRLRHQLLDCYEIFEGDFEKHYAIFDDVPLSQDSPFEAVPAEFIKEYENAAALADKIVFRSPEKRKATDIPTPASPDVSVPGSPSPDRCSKKLKSADTISPSPRKNSPGHRKRHDATAIRRSSRIAERKKKSADSGSS